MSDKHEEKRMVSWYFAVLERNSDGRYFAHLPDLQGVVAAGESAGDVLQELSERAARYLLDLAKHSEKIPEPRDYDQLTAGEKFEGQTALVPVTLPGRAVKISISMNDSLLVQIDAAAARDGMSRSGYLAFAAMEKLESDAVAALTYSTQVRARDGSLAVVRIDEPEVTARWVVSETFGNVKSESCSMNVAASKFGFWNTGQPTFKPGGHGKPHVHRGK